MGFINPISYKNQADPIPICSKQHEGPRKTQSGRVRILLHFKAISHDSFFYSLRMDLKGTGYSVSEKFHHKSNQGNSLFFLKFLLVGALQKDTNYIESITNYSWEKESKFGGISENRMPTR